MSVMNSVDFFAEQLLMRFGGLRILLRLGHVDPVVHYANSVSVQHKATLENDILCGTAPP